MAANGTTGVHRAPRRARRPGPGRDPGRRLLRARPRVAAGTRPRRPAPPDGVGARSDVRTAAAWRVAGRACLGAGPADVARPRRLRLDDPRRRALPRGIDPRGEALGSLLDRRPGQPPARLRDRAGSPLPDPVPGGRRGHRLPARSRDRGWRAHRDDGRRRREVRVVAEDVGALLGRGPLGRPLLRGARDQRRLADHDHAVDLAGGPPADRSRLHPDRLVRGDGRVGAAARREPPLPLDPQGRQGEGPAGGALAARRVLAQLPGQVPRDQRPAQADAADLRRGRRDGGRAGSGARARPPVPRPVQRLLLARAVRRGLHRPHAPGDVPPPHRRGGPRRHGRRAARVGRGHRPRPRRPGRCPAGRTRPGRLDRPDRGRRHRRLGYPRESGTRWRRSCAGDRRPTTRRCATTRRSLEAVSGRPRKVGPARRRRSTTS